MAKSKSTLFGVDDNWIVDSAIGIFVAVAMILFSKISPVIGAIGIPFFPASLAGELGRFLIVVVSAPIFEEIFFREITQDFIQNKMNLGLVFGMIGSSLAFMAFHLVAYGGQFTGASGSFITVFLAGMIFAGVRYTTKSNIGNIFCHAIFNLWVFSAMVISIA